MNREHHHHDLYEAARDLLAFVDEELPPQTQEQLSRIEKITRLQGKNKNFIVDTLTTTEQKLGPIRERLRTALAQFQEEEK